MTKVYHRDILLSMETRRADTTLLRWPDDDLHSWTQAEARRQGRSKNAEIVMALRYWKQTRSKKMLHIPEEREFNIGVTDIEWDRKIIAGYEAKISEFEAKAANATGPRRGAYEGHITKTKRNLDAASGNLAYHLDWLKRFSPEVYKEVTSEEVTS